MSEVELAEYTVLFLLGGGDGGGIGVDGQGNAHPIEPFGPAVADLSAAIGQLCRATEGLPREADREELGRITGEATRLLARGLGIPDSVHTLAYTGDDGPWCGTRPGAWHPVPVVQVGHKG